MRDATAEWFTLGWEIFVTIASLSAVCVSLWASKNFVKRAELEKLTQEIAALKVSVSQVESDLKHAPQREDFQQLTRQIADLNQKLSTIDGSFQANSHLLAVIHDHLLNAK